ncbi:non-ribosomal peptide synthetase [Melittangium boletus]|uniref:Non-ribosomal peptide synthetase n=1 Tax=Melittangium boletus DSM 14713 TaxID=1294270 RepID=A0A250IJA5_9BACT|nr:non-ribosomal peptide synthetase [Melittangium boletus]ATB31217.1 non-ribosomal peptide synthetase [Melittangium boletus DSM 14713]
MKDTSRLTDEASRLSPSQRRLWLLTEFEPAHPGHQVAVAWRLSGALDAVTLEKSFQEITRRQEMTRTCLGEDDGEPLPRVLAENAVRLVYEDLRGVPASEREARLGARLREEGRRAFNLFEGPLLRATLFQLDTREYALLFVAHRLIADATSLTVLARELSILQTQAVAPSERVSMGDAFLAGRLSYGDLLAQQRGLPAPPLTHARHVDERLQWLEGSEAAEQVGYWKTRLAGVTPLELPLDRPRPPVRSLTGGRYDFELSAPLAERIRAFARQEKTEVEGVLLAAFAAVLHRGSGQEDITVGVRRDGRRRPELKGLVAPLADELPLRVTTTGQEGFRPWVRHVSEALRALQAHEDVPFGVVLDALRPPPDLSRTPVFQVLFSLEEPPTGLELPGMRSWPLDVDLGAAPFDLSLRVVGGGGALRAFLEYDTALLDPATLERMATHLRTLLEAALEEPERPLSALPLMAEGARRRMLESWNDTRADYPRDATVASLIEAQVAHTPDAVALVYEGHSLTYRELNERANRLAWHLRGLGVGPEVLVGVALERSVEMVIAPLAVLKAGGAYVPLDPAYPRERLTHMLRVACPPVLITTRASQAALPETEARVVTLDTLALASGGEDTNPPATAGARNLAYLLFTSGSTGQPAGVQVEHGALVNLLYSVRREPGLREGDSLLAVTTLSFDIAGVELYLPLLVGARVVLAPREVTVDGARLRALLEASAPTVLQATPATWRMLLEAGWTGGGGPRAISTGEALPVELSRRLLATGVELWNMYGPTETTVFSSGGRIDGQGPISIGRPIANTTLHLLDASLRPVPVGSRGMLYIGGEGLARGYRGRPDTTAERFIPDPFSSEPGARMYRTGDEARFLPGGTIEYLGRGDFQVKVRGFRIELGDVEAALARHPQVRQAVVVAREDTPGTRRLVAYVVPTPSGAPSWSELRGFLLDILPEYMVPSACVVLDAMPLTPVGKVDRRGLPSPERARPSLDGARVSPRTPEEHTLARVWSEVLGLNPVGIQDSFFDLGGDSLLATRVVARAARAGLRITARQLAQQQTIERLAAVATPVQEPSRGESSSVEGEVVPLPILQWWLEGNPGYLDHDNCALMLEAPADVDAALLEQACRALIAHHDSLRLRLHRRPEGGWRLAYGPALEDPFWSVIDLSAVSAEELPGVMLNEANRLNMGLDLARGPLMRVTLFRLPGPSCRLHLVFHHLLVDEISIRLFVDDLQLAYEQLQRGEPVRLPPLATTIQRWGESLREYARSPEILKDLPYWRQRVQAPFQPLPVDFPSGTSLNSAARFTPLMLPAEETRALLEELPRRLGTTPDDVMLTAALLALEGLTHQRSQHLHVAWHGRDLEVPGVDVSRTVGWFGSITPVFLDASGTADTLGALRAIQAQLRAVPSKGLSWSLLRYLSEDESLRRELAAAPRPEVVYSYVGAVDPKLDPTAMFRPAREFPGMEHAPNATRTDRIALIGMTMGGQLQLMVLTCETLFRRETIEGFVDRMRSHLLEMAALATSG